MGIVIGIGILSLLVFIHELGHFLFAKWHKVRVETFSIGFGPKVLKKRIGETEYCVSAVLFGGYVKMTGQEDMGNPGERNTDPADFRNKTIFQRVQIGFAGPLFNYLFALAALVFLYWQLGIREAPSETGVVVGYIADSSRAQEAGFALGDTLVLLSGKPVGSWDDALLDMAMSADHAMSVTVGRASGRISLTLVPKKIGRDEIGWSGLYKTEPVIIGKVVAGSPAEKAGLRDNDTVRSIDNETVPGWNFLVDKIGQAGTSTVTLAIRRPGGDTLVRLAPEYNQEQKRAMIGIHKGVTLVLNRYPFNEACRRAVAQTGRDAVLIWKFLKALVTTRVSVKSMAGPVGIVHITGQMSRGGLDLFIIFFAMISVNLALVNLFPFFIITDGGVIFFLLVEALRGRPLEPRKQMVIQQTAVFFLIALFVMLTFNDIFRLIGGGG
ncbi:MAG: RIP metalloprotease RseP [Candidatus Raymondbacteria bacterium RifOxyA12_full_50_37]|nr:MAG: RIP metalloprotease RseP [Candidatus Raymondbacteria bacterium RifOxyA12_full_50_37]OGJ92394.1 MAG: RIP metalloprotease RseP [Candidatus Raymondbacteria bacterium RIFOXYA2_FULL_49_16]OGJ98761.1 MAG: RIP metalloprotease RseP [Candidatus Raymondbacteria bacterium RifOxyB12_full_50_8]OGJ99375.1 MAG: RIP metalloprotease RseP [Candidatus Raymondbacteria bacterium RIFOXYC2_FULL_50_21]OGP44287.1 MAG: RIP metalloprotease RseP [Candidatus Raymondbacteria bacterium RIFOXYB2_FULL_49_35]